MWSHERQAKILELLGRDGKVLTNHLAELLAVSRETVRRDLLEMETSGSLSRVHGGAILPGAEILPEPAFAQRLGDHAQAKDAIATKACELIPAGATLMIDTGTTTLAFARALLVKGLAVGRDARISDHHGAGGFRCYAHRPNLAGGTRRENPYSATVACFGISATKERI